MIKENSQSVRSMVSECDLESEAGKNSESLDYDSVMRDYFKPFEPWDDVPIGRNSAGREFKLGSLITQCAHWVVDLYHALKSYNLDSFLERYPKRARVHGSTHPASILGLIILGVMTGHTHLSQIHTMARIDLRAWWLGGGCMPTPEVLNKFLQRHIKDLNADLIKSIITNIPKENLPSKDEFDLQSTLSAWHCIERNFLEKELSELTQEAKRKATPELKKQIQQYKDRLRSLPSGSTTRPSMNPKSAAPQSHSDPAMKRISKTAFVYDSMLDCYYCPNGRMLIFECALKPQGTSPACRRYRSKDCSQCSLSDRCLTLHKDGTRSTARTIKRFQSDDLKDRSRNPISHYDQTAQQG